MPLLPARALEHRRRRELIECGLPIPEGLREGREEFRDHGPTTTTTTTAARGGGRGRGRWKRRAYDVVPPSDGGDDDDDDGRSLGEGGDVVDTGSSVTSFPCSNVLDNIS